MSRCCSNGELGQGGQGSQPVELDNPRVEYVGGGGGGGGYYGGGGGGNGFAPGPYGGGGGSGYGPAGTVFQTGVREGHGRITITYSVDPPPRLDTIDPHAGPARGGTVVTIRGDNLTGPTGATAVTFGGTAAPAVNCASATVCTATSPPGSGEAPVRVTVNGQTSARDISFLYVPGPTLTAVSPDHGSPAGGTEVTLTGETFALGATSVAFGGTAATRVGCSSATTCTAVSPPGTGTVPVTVTTPYGTSNGLPFTYGEPPAPPSLAAVSPFRGPQTGGWQVTLMGSGFASAPGATTVAFGATAATGVSCASSTVCTATLPPGTGTVPVTVTTPLGTSNGVPFTYFPAPVLRTVSPGQGPAAGGTQVTLIGETFVQGGTTVAFGAAPATGVSCDGTSCAATSPPGAGTVPVTVTTPYGTSTGLPFTYAGTPPAPPSVTGIGPATGPAAGGTRVTIQGANFSTAASTTTVAFGGNPATAVSCSTSTTCTATSPAGTGTVGVRVTVGGQTSADTLADDFTYAGTPPPAASCAGVPATIVATPGVVTQGTPGRDVIVGTPANDTIYGNGGDDLICDAGGDDALDGGLGDDVIYGEAGADALAGGGGDDTLHGGDGADRLSGGGGKDILNGDAGADALDGDDGDDTLNGGPDTDTLRGGAGNDTLTDTQGLGQVFDGGMGTNTCIGVATAQPSPPGSVASCQVQS